MTTYGANLRRIFRLAHISAIPALPPYLAVASEKVAVRHTAQQFQIALFMLYLDFRYHPESRCDFGNPSLSATSAKVGYNKSHSSRSPSAAARRLSMVFEITPDG